MIGTLINTKLRPGEPYFALIGRDGSAPGLVDQWADINRRRALADFNGNRIDAEERDRELRKSTEAEMLAGDMRAYKKEHPTESKQERETVSYSGHELDEETKRGDKLQSFRIRAVMAVSGAVAALIEVLPLLNEAGDLNLTIVAGQVDETLDHLKLIEKTLQPKRVGIDALNRDVGRSNDFILR